VTILTIGLFGCGGSPAPKAAGPKAPEVSPTGDIPDNQAYVAFQPQGGGWRLKVPEGWAQTGGIAGSVTFTDKLNAIQVTRRTNAPRPTAPSVESAVTATEGSRPGFALAQVDTVKRAAGTAHRAVYRVDGKPDPVTGKTVNNDVEQYTFWRNGTQVDLRLSGPHGADNVDPWKIITDSFRWA
jgi:hypothetical protein